MKHSGTLRNKRRLKGAMLHTVLKAQRNNLNKRLHERLAWWSSQTLSSVISITPALSEEVPFLSYDDNSLSELKLFGLNTEELRANVHAYWAKAAWKRWILRLLATPSYQQVKVWFYVKECLAFREMEQSLMPENFCGALVISYEQRVLENNQGLPEKRLLENLGKWFFQQEESFKESLKTRSAQWLSENFIDKLNDYEKRRYKKFLKQLKSKLKTFPGDDNQKMEAHDKARVSYNKIGEIMHKRIVRFVQNMYAPVSQQQHTRSNPEENLLSLVPSTTQPTVVATASLSKPIVPIELDGLDRTNFVSWLKDMRTYIRALLEQQVESQERDEQIKKLMNSNLMTLIAWVKQCLGDYESKVQQALLCQNKEPDKTLKELKDIKSDLSSYFKQGNLLFHPDHFSWATNKDLSIYWNELFDRYKTFFDESIESLKKSDKLIAGGLLKEGCYGELLLYLNEELKKINEELKEIAEEAKRFKEEIDLRITELEKKFAQDWKEMKTEIKTVVKEEVKAGMEGRINSQLQEMEQRLFDRFEDNEHIAPTHFTPSFKP